jgi:hypothetical protein
VVSGGATRAAGSTGVPKLPAASGTLVAREAPTPAGGQWIDERRVCIAKRFGPARFKVASAASGSGHGEVGKVAKRNPGGIKPIREGRFRGVFGSNGLTRRIRVLSKTHRYSHGESSRGYG